MPALSVALLALVNSDMPLCKNQYTLACYIAGPYLKVVYGFNPPDMSKKNFAALNLQRINCDFANMAPCSACLLGLHFCHHSILCNTMILTFKFSCVYFALVSHYCEIPLPCF